ncbi:MAG TPA: DMT family transporter [Anaerolineae bacterium]|jgi:drug/metabolite transporter (DMT)-like permease|nr:DMT family transporter [Anaerolineae bacterium]
MKRDLKAYSKLALGRIIAGSTVVVGKLAVASFPVFLISGLRLGIAAAILLFLLIKREKGIPSVNRKDLSTMFLQAFTGVFLFSILLLYGLKMTSAIESGSIISITPAAVGLISVFFLRERLTWKKGIGIAVSVLGLLIISALGSSLSMGKGPNPLFGSFLISGAVIGEALFITFGKIESKRVSPLTISALVSAFGFLMFLPLSIYEASSFDFSKVPLVGWVSIVYYGAIGTVFSYKLWQQGISEVPASTAAVFVGFLPISAVLLSSVVLEEPFAWIHAIGIAVILSGVAFIAKDSP